MANVDAGRGGSSLHGDARMNDHKVAAANSAIYINSPVKLTADGVDLAAAGDRLLGFSAEYKAALAGATSGTRILVYDDPKDRFRIQADGNTVEADIGQLADHTTEVGSTTTLLSTVELSTAGQGTSEAQLRIVDKIYEPNNDWGTNVDLVVEIYEHEFSRQEPGTPGV